MIPRCLLAFLVPALCLASFRSPSYPTSYTPSIGSSVPAGNVYLGTIDYRSLLSYAFAVEVACQKLSKIQPNNFTYTDPLSRSLVENSRPGGFLNKKIIGLTMEAHNISKETSINVRNVSFYLFISMGPLLLALLAAVVSPLLVKLERTRDEVMERFLDIPPLVLTTLRTLAERRLKNLRADEDEDLAGEDGRNPADGNNDERNGGFEEDDLDDGDDEGGCAATALIEAEVGAWPCGAGRMPKPHPKLS